MMQLEHKEGQLVQLERMKEQLVRKPERARSQLKRLGHTRFGGLAHTRFVVEVVVGQQLQLEQPKRPRHDGSRHAPLSWSP
jgi:hypothetical protein